MEKRMRVRPKSLVPHARLPLALALALAPMAACSSGGQGPKTGAAGSHGGGAGSSGAAGMVGGAAGDTGAAGSPGAAGETGAAGDTSGAAGDASGAAGALTGLGGTTGGGGTGGTGSPATGGAGGTGSGSAGKSGSPDGGALGAAPDGDLSTATPIGDQTLPRKLYIYNMCAYDIWTFGLPNGTTKIAAGALQVFGWSNKFSGRVWPRSGCTGTGNTPKCAQTGNDTLAEFTLNAGMKDDWYDISLVDGFTIPLSILQLDGKWTPDPAYVPGGKLLMSGNCGSPVCAVDLLKNCPVSQQVKDAMGNVVECKNGMSSNGGHGPTPVTSYMKMGCPTSYTFAFDDPQSLFTCPSVEQNGGVGARDYEIVYCPPQSTVPGSGFP
jgi:hypothetical protein